MGKLLGAVTFPNVISRHRELALTDAMLVDGTIHANDKIIQGTLMVKATIGGNSKWVAYCEGLASAVGATTSPTVQLDPTTTPRAQQWFRPGMPVAKVHAGAPTTLGTVLAYNPATGVLTLAANAAAAVAVGDIVSLDPAVYPIGYNKARVLVDELLLEEGTDDISAGYFKGFFNQAATSITAAAAALLGAVAINAFELEIK